MIFGYKETFWEKVSAKIVFFWKVFYNKFDIISYYYKY